MKSNYDGIVNIDPYLTKKNPERDEMNVQKSKRQKIRYIISIILGIAVLIQAVFFYLGTTK